MLIILCTFCLSMAIASDTWIIEHSNKWPFYIPIQNHWPEPKPGLSLILIQMLRLVNLMYCVYLKLYRKYNINTQLTI